MMKKLLVHLKDLGIYISRSDSAPTPQDIRDLNSALWHALTCHCRGIGMEMFLPAKLQDENATFTPETAWEPKDWLFANFAPEYVKSAVMNWNKDIERDVLKTVTDYSEDYSKITDTNARLRAAQALEYRLHTLLTDEVVLERTRCVVRGLDTAMSADISPSVWASVQDSPEEWAILTVQ